jgi:hypothetical protein
VGLVCCAGAVRCPDWGSNERGWSEGERVEDLCKILHRVSPSPPSIGDNQSTVAFLHDA